MNPSVNREIAKTRGISVSEAATLDTTRAMLTELSQRATTSRRGLLDTANDLGDHTLIDLLLSAAATCRRAETIVAGMIRRLPARADAVEQERKIAIATQVVDRAVEVGETVLAQLRPR